MIKLKVLIPLITFSTLFGIFGSISLSFIGMFFFILIPFTYEINTFKKNLLNPWLI